MKIKLSSTVEFDLDDRYFEPTMQPKSLDEDFELLLEDLRTWWTQKESRSFSGKKKFEQKLRNFTRTQGFKPWGMTNVDIAGRNTIGPRPKDDRHWVERGIRDEGMDLWAESYTEAVSDYLKREGYVISEDHSYEKLDDALVDIEVSSLAAKGPYDNSTDIDAPKSINTILDYGSKAINQLDSGVETVWRTGLVTRISEYRQVVNRAFVPRWQDYLSIIERSGLKSTLRGFPLYQLGNEKLSEESYMMTKWMFNDPEIFSDPILEKEALVGDVTCDEFIQLLLIRIYDQLKRDPMSMFTLRHSVVIPISRDQGSPYLIEEDGQTVKLVDASNAAGGGKYSRKERKFRAVCPVSFFVQATLVVGARDLVKKAPSTHGRVGLLTPAENVRDFNTFVEDLMSSNMVGISTDYSGFDATLSSYQLGSQCGSYAALYDNPITKSVFAMGANALVHKTLIAPIIRSDATINAWKDYKLGDVGLTNKRDQVLIAREVSRSRNRKVDTKSSGVPPYDVVAIHVYKSWLISGIFLTNTIGSDCALNIARSVVPLSLGFVDRNPAIASGDDTVFGVPKQMYDTLGYAAVNESISEAVALTGQIVNAKKALRTIYKGYPLIDFLQDVVTQWSDDSHDQLPYRKFLRQLPAVIYSERYSKLDFMVQWVIVAGKLESGLCDRNLDLAAHILSTTTKLFFSKSKQRNYHVPMSREELSRMSVDMKANLATSSEMGGFKELFGLVKQYGQATLSELGKYASTQVGEEKELVATLSNELETRAPHRAVLANALVSGLGEGAKVYVGSDLLGLNSQYHFKFVDLMEKASNFYSESLKPVILEQAGKTVTVGEGAAIDDSIIQAEEDAGAVENSN